MKTTKLTGQISNGGNLKFMLLLLSITLAFSACKKDDDGSVLVDAIDVCTEIGSVIDEDFVFENNPDAPVDYFIDCILRVSADLSIEPGTVIEMGADAGIITVNDGSVAALGSSSDPIVIRGFEKVSGYWAGIAILSDNQKNEFNYVEISHGSGTNSTQGGPIATILCSVDAQLKFTNNTLSQGGGYGYYQSLTADLTAYENNTITSHAMNPVYIHANDFGQLDGEGSSYTGNDMDMIRMAISAGSVITVTTSQTWQNPGVPVILDEGTMGIRADLTIEPGFELVCRQDVYIAVNNNGSFNAVGTAAKPIVIRGEQSLQGYWTGMYLDGTSVLNKMEYVELSDGGKDKPFGAAPTTANLFISSATTSFSVSNSTISNSLGCGIYTSNAGVTLTNNTYSNNAENDVCP